MDRLNERIRSMFDLVGQSVREFGNLLAPLDQSQSVELTMHRSSSASSLRSRSRISSERSNVRSAKRTRRRGSSLRVSPVVQPRRSKEQPFAPGLATGSTFNPDGLQSGLSAGRYDCAAFLIHCERHHRVAVSKPSSKQALWMPFMPIPTHKNWEESALAGLLILLSNANTNTFLVLKDQPPFSKLNLLEVCQIQLPQTREMISRISWYIPIDVVGTGCKHYQCCQDSDIIQWVADSQVDQGQLEYLWGPEVIQFYKCVIQGTIACSFVENDIEQAFQFLPRDPPRTDEEAMLHGLQISEKVVERVYCDYLDHCFPATSMAYHSFKVYLSKYCFQFDETRISQLFHAFNYRRNGYITFPELLMGLACIDPHSSHNECRAKFIMRYYDQTTKGFLSRDDIRQMISDMDPEASTTDLDAKLNQVLIQMDPNFEAKGKITFNVFLSSIGSHRFRGTSKLCRSAKPVFMAIQNEIIARAKRSQGKAGRLTGVLEPSYPGVCLGCKERRPILEDTIVIIDSNGYVSGHKKLFEKSEVRGNKKGNRHKSTITTNSTGDEDDLKKMAWKVIRDVRAFVNCKGTVEKPVGIYKEQRSQLSEYLSMFETRLGSLLEKEPRCMQVSSPVYIMGDIHGNLEDLLSLERAIWKRFPVNGANLLFLGDYVDRGRWSVECALYLFALKVLAPNQVTLIRGNHEVRALQEHYSYKLECLAKYGSDLGNRVWETTNRIFDRLPLCAVVDQSIYCAHGGIPRSTQEMSEILKQPNVLDDPEHDSAVAWEILWSDPLYQQQFLEQACFQKISAEEQATGFLPNRKRGTAFFFNETALDNFLRCNGLSHVVRAHEVMANGFCFHYEGKCATVFSCSHYCGNQNQCACLAVNFDQITIVRIDTTNNRPATD